VTISGSFRRSNHAASGGAYSPFQALSRRQLYPINQEIPARAGLLQAGYFTGATFLTPR